MFLKHRTHTGYTLQAHSKSYQFSQAAMSRFSPSCRCHSNSLAWASSNSAARVGAENPAKIQIKLASVNIIIK